MSRCLGMVCAGMLMAATLGCTTDFLPVVSFTTLGQHQVVPGPVLEVSRRIEEGLSDAGIAVITKQLNGERRLAGQDKKTGKIFCIHLYDKKVGAEDRTEISIQWDRGSNEAFQQMVLQLARKREDSDSDAGGAAPLPSGKKDR